jgi:hypothetical protein
MAAPDANDDMQLWSFSHQGADVYKIQNVGDNSTLGIKDGWCGQFGDVQAGFDASSPYVLFKVTAADAAGTYVFEIAFNSACNFGSSNVPIKTFDIDGGNSGAKIQTFDMSTSNPNQQFEILEPSVLSISNTNDLSALDVFYTKKNGLVINSVNDAVQSFGVEVFDITGKSMQKQQFENLNESVFLKLDTLHSGLYIARISTENNQDRIVKFVVY